MRRATGTLVLLGLALEVSSAALAQPLRQIPIEHDLRRWDRVERSLEATGSIRPAPPVRMQDPSGVPGFNGPPGVIGDSVNSTAPLPPGNPGNEEW